MNYKNIVKEIVIEKIPSLNELSAKDFKSVGDYDKYIDWESGRYFNFTGENKIRSRCLGRIKEGLAERNISFKEYTVSVGFDSIKEIEII